MIWYIVGMVTGSVVMAFGLAFSMKIFFKNRSLKKLVKKIGKKSEDKINGDIKVWAKHTKNKFIPASLFSYGDNKVFEVDSILVTDKAIIVVEIKSIRGKIKGKAGAKYWSKILGDKTFAIPNPIIQNDIHMEHILKMSSIRVPMVSLIVFSNRAEYLNISTPPGHVIITREVDLFNTLDEINNKLKSKLSSEKVLEIFKTLKSFKTNSRKAVKLHQSITTQNGEK